MQEKQTTAFRKKKSVFWAFDSEFMMSGRAGDPADVHSVQFSNGVLDHSFCLESADALKDWLRSHRYVKVMYGFNCLCDLGSVEEWLGSNHVIIRRRGVQTRGVISFGGARIKVYDARPLLQAFGLRRLADCGEFIGFLKLPKPEWLGLRKWQNSAEHNDFVEYALADAVITSRVVKYLYDRFTADPEKHSSAGTLSAKVFRLPRRLKRRKKTVIVSPLEQKVRLSSFAGRSEGFVTGFTPNVVYNDVSSLYPCSIAVTRCLNIIGAQSCLPSDVAVSDDLNEPRYGWLDGVFETDNDLWGLPLRGRSNFYATGRIQGFYHTFDLAAAKAKVLSVAHAYKPVFKSSLRHKAYVELLLKRLEGVIPEGERMFCKAVLNSLFGKLGQSHPRPARTSNFFAFSTVVAHAHFVMSKLFDRCPSKILGTDTDSIFSQSDMSGKHFELTDGEYSVPVIMDVKGKGDLAFFRSKNYLLRQSDGKFVYGRHGWQYWVEDFFKLWDGVTELTTRRDIKHTLLTRERAALKMAKGRWRTKIVNLDLSKIKGLLRADLKRQRPDYDSYQLFLDRKNVDSQAWRYENIMDMTENPLDYPIFYY